MSFKPTEQQLIDFVYGNLPEAERTLMNEAIKDNEGLSKEIEGLMESKSFLHNLEDEEVLEPERMLWNAVNQQHKTRGLWPYIAVAASLVLLLVVGYATQFRVQYGAFELAFGSEAVAKPPQALTNEQVQSMINKSIVANNVDFVSKLEDVKSNFSTQLASNNKLQLRDMQRIAASTNKVPQKDVKAYLAQLGEANRTMLNDFFEVSAGEQQEYINSILTDYFEYMDEKRKDDFKILQASIEDVKYDSDQKIKQTDQVVASILTTVGGGSMGQ